MTHIVPLGALVGAGLFLGLLGDLLLRAPDGIGLNVSVWVAAVAAAALLLHRQTGGHPAPPDAGPAGASNPPAGQDRERVMWLVAGALFAAGFSWRNAPFLLFLALGAAIVSFALAAHRVSAAWVRRSGVMRYPWAVVLGGLHAWLGSVLILAHVLQRAPARASATSASPSASGRHALAVLRGLALALPLVILFGLLFISADAVFADVVARVLRFNIDELVSHAVVFAIFAWIATGYLRGFVVGTDSSALTALLPDQARNGSPARRPLLGITEVGTALGAVNLLFLAFVLVQFRYLFGGQALVQVTPNLTYAEYARRGFFELVVAVGLVVPILLAADWLLDRRVEAHVTAFRRLASLQVVLILAIAASALQRLRLYYATYGLTEARFYGMAFLVWMAVVLLWLVVTVLRDRRQHFAFGALVSGGLAVALLFLINPDALIARVNVARMSTADSAIRFDVAYASSLSADAVPVLIDALPRLPADVQCPLADHLLRGWPPASQRSLRSWNWSASRASAFVRTHEQQLRAAVGPGGRCAGPPVGHESH